MSTLFDIESDTEYRGSEYRRGTAVAQFRNLLLRFRAVVPVPTIHGKPQYSAILRGTGRSTVRDRGTGRSAVPIFLRGSVPQLKLWYRVTLYFDITKYDSINL